MDLTQKYKNEVIPALRKEFGYTNAHQVPKIEKVVVNVGFGKAKDDSKLKDLILANVKAISGQHPVLTLSKKSISNFKIRKGLAIGAKVTLRGRRMYEFLARLIHITFPRVRDFQGIDAKSVDQNGNMNIGFREQVPFPEMRAESIEKLHGLEVTVVSTAQNREKGLALFRHLGFPLKK